MKTSIVAHLMGAAAALALATAPTFAAAQAYPSSNPTYIPTAVVPATTLTAAGDVTLNANGLGTITARIAGTNTGVAGVFQGTNERSANPTWTTIGAVPVGASGGGAVSAVTGNGLYRLNASGFSQVRFHMTAISTGSAVVTMAGTPGPSLTAVAPVRRSTYSAAVTALAPAASATDFFTLTGAAGVTVRINHVECSGISTAAATATVNALLRSTANSAGTSSAATAVPHDSSDPAATATALSYTANPTTGTLVGVVRSGKLTTVTAASTAVLAGPLSWDFGTGQHEEVTLRGTGQVFALNGAGASFTSGAALNCSVTWTEE